MIELPDGDFAFIETSKIDVWPRIGLGRVQSALLTQGLEVALEMQFYKCLPNFKSELSLDN